MNDKPIINGIDVSECEYYDDGTCCNKDVLALSCDTTDCIYKQLKRLQEENKRLQMLSCVNCGEQYLSPDGAELYEKNVQLQKENEELKEKIKDLDAMTGIFSVRLANKYKQALEEIRSYCDEQNLKADYTACFITNRIDEVLNDRD